MIFLLFLILNTTSAFSQEAELSQIEVHSSRVRVSDALQMSSQKLEVPRPASDLTLGESLNKLPGVLVRNTSGPGSLTTVLGTSALSSGSTPISIDNIPQPDPLGVGINLSLFPQSLFTGVSVEGPFYPIFHSDEQTLLAPASRVNLKLPTHLKKQQFSILGGQASTLQGSWIGPVLKSDSKKEDLIAGLSVFNTKGEVPYNDPYVNTSSHRYNNNAFGTGGLLKKNFSWNKNGEATIFGLGSYLSRTNPGDIRFPTRDHEEDFFAAVGAQLRDPDFFREGSGFSAKISSSYYRILVRDPNDVFLTRTNGTFESLGYHHRSGGFSLFAGIDQRFELLRSVGIFANRSIWGVGVIPRYDFKYFSLGVQVRHEINSKDSDEVDSSVFAETQSFLGVRIFAGFGWLHQYPSIPSRLGSNVGNYKVLANPDLFVERDRVIQTGFTYENPELDLGWYQSFFKNDVFNRSVYTFINASSSQVVNSSLVEIHGFQSDVQWGEKTPVYARAGVTYLRANEVYSGFEMPYKPRWQGRALVGFKPKEWIGFSVQEEYLGKRNTALNFGEQLPSFFQTTLRVDLNPLENMSVFFKLQNLFDRQGLENVGYPFSGRMWFAGLGYEI